MSPSEEEQAAFEASPVYEKTERGAREKAARKRVEERLDALAGRDHMRKVLREHYLVCVVWPQDGTGQATPACICKLGLGHYTSNDLAVDGWISHLLAEMAKAGVRLA